MKMDVIGEISKAKYNGDELSKGGLRPPAENNYQISGLAAHGKAWERTYDVPWPHANKKTKTLARDESRCDKNKFIYGDERAES